MLTPEGEMPSPEHAEVSGRVKSYARSSCVPCKAISSAIARADMRPWELEATSNPPAQALVSRVQTMPQPLTSLAHSAEVDPANPPPLIAPATQEAVAILHGSCA